MAFDSSFTLRGWILASLLSVVITGLGASPAYPAEPGKFWVFVGTYTGGKSKGIYRMEFDPATGKLSEPVLAAEVDNPSFLAVHPTHKYLYSANESSAGAGSVTAFALDAKSGELTKLNQQSTIGDGPCHLVVDATGKNVLVANYGGGSVAVLPIGPDGKLRLPRISFSTKARCSTPDGRGSRTPTRSISTRRTVSPRSPTSASTGSFSTSSTQSKASSRPMIRRRPR